MECKILILRGYKVLNVYNMVAALKWYLYSSRAAKRGFCCVYLRQRG